MSSLGFLLVRLRPVVLFDSLLDTLACVIDPVLLGELKCELIETLEPFALATEDATAGYLQYTRQTLGVFEFFKQSPIKLRLIKA